MAWFEPNNHRVVVAFSHMVLVGPLVLLWLKLGYWTCTFLKGIRVVTQPQVILIIAPCLSHAHKPCVCKGINVWLVTFFILELMIILLDAVVVQVQSSDSILVRLKHHNLPVWKHPKRVYTFLEFMLIEYVSLFVTVHQTVPANTRHSKEDKGVTSGSW